MTVTLLEHPTDWDWLQTKRRALVTAGLDVKNPPDQKWKEDRLNARHSPIRRLHFSFLMEDIPYWLSVHLCRHVHAQPYVRSQRNDRQSAYDRNSAPQNAPVDMIWDMNAEELMVVCNKRLCMTTAPETRMVVEEMRNLVVEACPEFNRFLVPNCEYHGGVCHEIKSCRKRVKG